MKKLILLLLACITYTIASAQYTSPPNNMKEYEEAYKWRIRQSKLNDTYIPKNLNDVFLRLDQLIEAPSKVKFKKVDEMVAARNLHFSLGRWMIHNWGFYGGSRLSHYLKGFGLSHPDDMARFLIITYHRKLTEKELAPKQIVEKLLQNRKDHLVKKK